MAAITTLMEIFKPGDHIISEADLYGGSIRLFDHINQKNGIEFSRINFAEEDPENYIKEKTKAIYIETPTNPMMNVIDIRKTAEREQPFRDISLCLKDEMSAYINGCKKQKAEDHGI